MRVFKFHGRDFTITPHGCVITDKGRLLKPTVDQKGYHRVWLTAGRKHRKQMAVHRLVAMTYLKRNFMNHDCTQVNHKNGNKGCNHYENLEWVTGKQNVQHAIATGLTQHPTGFAARRARLTPKLLDTINAMLANGDRQIDIAAATGISQPVISQVKRKVRSWY